MVIEIKIAADDPARFMLNVEKEKSGCWTWTGSRQSKDPARAYGRFYVGHGISIKAHRFSYFHFIGDPGKLFVCHKCDNPICVNPEHLFLGNHSDNAKDAKNKGRLHEVWKDPSWKSKLTHCIRGHELKGDNLRIGSHGNRVCKECMKIYHARSEEVRKAAGKKRDHNSHRSRKTAAEGRGE